MNRTTKTNILAYASEPDKNYNFFGDIVEYQGKRYFVSLEEERVEFLGNAMEESSIKPAEIGGEVDKCMTENRKRCIESLGIPKNLLINE